MGSDGKPRLEQKENITSRPWLKMQPCCNQGRKAMQPRFPLNSNSRSTIPIRSLRKRPSQVLLTFFMAILQYEDAASDRFPYSHTHVSIHAQNVLTLLPSNEIVLTKPRSL
jgi:hypothetical protein